MNEPAIALVFSPEQWVERLHRHLADHGGARVRQIVLDPRLALEDGYDALVVSHRWPGLTKPFVVAVHDRGRRVLGVFDRDEPAGGDHLLALGADMTIESEAPVDEFVRALVALAATVTGSAVPAAEPRSPAASVPVGPVVVTGPSGSGASEVALALAGALSSEGGAILVDGDDVAPSLAPRLALGIEPNLRSAVDAVVYGLGQLGEVVIPMGRRLGVVAGFPGTAAAAQVRTGDVLEVLRALAGRRRHVVVDVSGAAGSDLARPVLDSARIVVVVGTASPVGVTRTLAFIAGHKASFSTGTTHVVCNRAPDDEFRRAELEHEIHRTFATAAGVWHVPADRRVDRATWDGSPVARGPFTRAIDELAHALVPTNVAMGRSGRRRAARRAA